MTEVYFYHLQRQPLEAVLPTLLEKSLEKGWRAVVRATSDERLAALDGAEVILLLVASDDERLQWMDGQARLFVDAREDVRIASAEVARGEAAVIAETLRRMQGGFVIGQFGGLVVPDEGNLRPLCAALECPLFLVR